MRKRSVFLIVLFLVVIAIPIVIWVEKPNQSIEGVWGGEISLYGVKSPIIVKIEKDDNDSLIGSLDYPTLRGKKVPIDEISFKKNIIRLMVKETSFVFEGQLSSNGLKILGSYKTWSNKLRLNLERDYVYIPIRPQEPKKPYPYTEEEVSYMNEKDGVKLASTLTIPRGEGPFPAVLLITGSGPQDRDETFREHKTFLVLADYLTRQGIAVLRVDDRGIGGSTGNTLSSTSADFANDVLAGVKFLKSHQDVDASQIGLIGHGEGGIIAPMVAVKSEDVGFIVLMAGSGVPGDILYYLSGRLVLQGFGGSEEEVKRNTEQQKEIYTILKEATNDKIAEEKLREYIQELMQRVTEIERRRIGDPDQHFSSLFAKLPWLRFFVSYDPTPTLEKVKCPVLAINGAKDTQVSPKENLLAIDTALKTGGNKDYTVIELANLNYLFQTCETGLDHEYGSIQETISPVALKTIGDWILQHTQTGTSSQ